MRRHPSVQELSAWLDHESGIENAAWIEQHLSDCVSCFAQVQEVGSARNRLRASGQLEPALRIFQ